MANYSLNKMIYTTNLFKYNERNCYGSIELLKSYLKLKLAQMNNKHLHKKNTIDKLYIKLEIYKWL
ncbi:hypothetical protein A9G12_07325 [Gilliamella sp. wkB112]|nr:hypothetical protein A9G12_07325 [Gilliamella apicola]